MRNWYCERCWDTGKIGLFFKKVCPVCNGEPKKYWMKKHPKPNLQFYPAPPKRKQEIEITLKLEGKRND